MVRDELEHLLHFKAVLEQSLEKLFTAHARLDALFHTSTEDLLLGDEYSQNKKPSCLRSLAQALEHLSSQVIVACKLLREENRLLRKERKIIMHEKQRAVKKLMKTTAEM